VAASITSGPRFDALCDALREAVEDFGAPLDEGELDSGWTDEQRLGVLAELHRGLEALLADPLARLANLDELLGEEVDDNADVRADALVAVDFAQGDLGLAEELLDATGAFLDELGSAIEPRDVAHGFDESARAALTTVVEDISRTLASGIYLGSGIAAAWDEVLTTRGLRRQVVNDEASPIFGGLASGRAGDMQLWPPGPRWEAVVLYDNALQQLLRRDLAVED
jgi:hypothetical protein